jgi:hypothetical protein
MKTTVEINGYFIDVEEKDGVISVTATFEDEVIEEFSIEVEEGQEAQDDVQDEVQGFDEFDQEEEEDFGQEEEEDDDEDENEKVEGQLESFQSFINKKK